MRSIRLSLAVYFLVLLAVALGAVFFLVDRVAGDALAAKEESDRERLHAEFEKDKLARIQETDRTLANLAERLADVVGREWGGTAPTELAAIAAPQTWYGYLALPGWLWLSEKQPETRVPIRRPLIRINNTEDDMRSLHRGVPYYFQIYSESGETLHRSKNMKDLSFTLDPVSASTLERFDRRSGRPRQVIDEDVEGPGKEMLRRVTIKAPIPLGTRRGGRIPSTDAAIHSVFIQAATPSPSRQQLLAQYEKNLADLAKDTSRARTSLRTQLLWISGLALAASTVGAIGLIAIGLAPLKRLSQAVRRISVKNFQLQLEGASLPRELRPIRHQLTQTLDQLRRAFAREKQSVADISHELRTPLAALLNTLEVGLRKVRSPEEYAKLLLNCQLIGEQMSELVERLLALARLDAGADVVRRRPVDMTGLADECVRLVRPIAETRDVTLAMQAPTAVTVDTDPDKLREIVTNLLHNAVEYNKPGGRIDLTLSQTNGQARLLVRDTGIGIPEAHRARIFERFYRVDDSRHADGMHAGLGLAIVRAYTDLLGGTIRVESREGEGTTFELQLPARSSS
jgi:signal transduction histidine kinase